MIKVKPFVLQIKVRIRKEEMRRAERRVFEVEVGDWLEEMAAQHPDNMYFQRAEGNPMVIDDMAALIEIREQQAVWRDIEREEREERRARVSDTLRELETEDRRGPERGEREERRPGMENGAGGLERGATGMNGETKREEEESDGELSEGMAETDRQLARIEKVMRCNKCPPCGCGCHGEEGTRDCTHQRKDGGDYRGNQTEAKKEEGGQKSGTRNGQK